jgi:hypothetical protein
MTATLEIVAREPIQTIASTFASVQIAIQYAALIIGSTVKLSQNSRLSKCGEDEKGLLFYSRVIFMGIRI